MVRRRYSTWLPVLPLLLLLLLLVACGGDDESGEPVANETPLATEAMGETPMMAETTEMTEEPTAGETAESMEGTGTTAGQPVIEEVMTQEPEGVMTDTITLEANAGTAEMTGTPEAAGTEQATDTAAATITPQSEGAVTGMARLTALTELAIVDSNNQENGRVAELLVDNTGNILYVIFAAQTTGATAGDPVAIVPWEQFQGRLNVVDEETERHLTYSGTREELEGAQTFDAAVMEQEGYTLLPDDLADELELGSDELADGSRFILIGRYTDFNLVNGEGEDLGEVEEVLLDLEEGRVAYAVIDFGGFLGVGEQSVAVPWERLTLDEESEEFTLAVDSETLQNAPTIDLSEWQDPVETEWDADVVEFWNSVQ